MQKLASRSKSPLLHRSLHQTTDLTGKLQKPVQPFDPDFLFERTNTLAHENLQASKVTSVEERHRIREEEKAARELALQLKLDEERAVTKMRWVKKTAKLKGNLPDSEYYANLPIKPGFFFLKSLVHTPKAHLKTLRINIPETLYHSGHLWYIKTENGVVTCDDSVGCIDFLKLREREKCSTPKHAFDHIAAILRRRGDSEGSMIKYILDWPQFRNKMITRDLVEGFMVQKFIRSVGDKASAIRLQYHPYSNKANIAYFMSNIKSERPEDFYKCVVNIDAVDSFEIFRLQGTAIKEIERCAWEIVDYLDRAYAVRIEEIHLDFLKDEQGVLWLCGCRGFRLDQISVSRSLSPISQPPSTQALLTQLADDRKKGRFIRCKLCRLHYKNQELPHLISVRMLFVYKMHTTKRVNLPINMDHLRLVTADLLSQSARICELCFILVTSEFQLIEAEKRLAEAVNIKVIEEELEENPVHIMQLQFLPKRMIQWRVLLHFRVIDNQLHNLLSKKDVKFTMDLFEYQNEFDVVVDQNEIVVNKLKMTYFFSSPEKPIRKFLNEIQLKVGLKCSGETVASGESLLLYNFPSSLPMGVALTQTRLISIFPYDNTTPVDLNMTVGLSCDQYYESKNLKVGLTKTNDVYVPEPHYFNSTPLPVDWMEQFGGQMADNSFKAEIAPEDFYESTLTREEIRRMKTVGSERAVLSKTRASTPGLPPLSSRISAFTQRLPDVPSLDFSGLAGSHSEQTVQELLFSVNGYLQDRPVSALSNSAQERSRSVMKRAQTTRLEPALRSISSLRKRRKYKDQSTLSTRLEASSPSLRVLKERFKEISRVVGEDIKAYGAERDKVTLPPRSWAESYSSEDGD